jgi:ankyrin repeat protein
MDDLDIDQIDEKEWTGLLYTVVGGFADVVKIILERERVNNINRAKNTLESKIESNSKEGSDPFVKPLDSMVSGKYTPLHWAAYKGHVQISSILLKFGFNPLDIDKGGNTALHQAAASNSLKLFKLFMGLGLDLEMKNSRNHSPSDLTSNPEIKKLIQKTLAIKNCQICNKAFNFHIKRYLCIINEEVICSNCCICDVYYLNLEAQERDILECRCKKCVNVVTTEEANIHNAIRGGELTPLKEVYNHIRRENINICCKVMKEAELQIEKLEREKNILDHINSLKIVDDHKIIEKSVFTLEQMIKEAKERNIELDISVAQNAFLEKNRLLAERDLRRLLSNLTLDKASPEYLQELKEKLTNAVMCKVSEQYVDQGKGLENKIELNLNAKDLLGLFVAYPIREYPPVEVVDPKKSKNKFKIGKTQPPPKKPKRKKKEPPFLIPEWAKELAVLQEKVKLNNI